MKKIIFVILCLSTLICIFCISSAALTIGENLLNPASYHDDPNVAPQLVVLGRYEYGDDLVVFKFAEYGDLNDLGSTDGIQILFDSYSVFDNGFNWSFDIGRNSYSNGEQVKDHFDLTVDLSKYGFDSWDISPEGTNQMIFYTDYSFYPGSTYIDIFDLDEAYYSYSFPDYDYIFNDEPYGLPILAIFDFYSWDGTIPGAPGTDPPVTDLPLTPGNINTVLGKIFEFPVDILSQIFTATNTLYAFISVFVFYMFVRFILKPIIGGSLGSDRVRRSAASPPSEDNSDD